VGQEQPAASQSDDSGGTVVYRKVFAQNSDRCMEEDTGVCLNLGAGKKRWQGWLNVDLTGDFPCDIRKLSFPDNYADAIAAIHVIEHFYQWEVLDILKEWRRVLKPGGKIILELPCMDKVFGYIAKCVSENIPLNHTFSTHALWGDPKYKAVEMCHKWGYTKGTLAELMAEAGFNEVRTEEALYHFPQRDMRLVAFK
jgi:predicted SAM-dependent methyltransferase